MASNEGHIHWDGTPLSTVNYLGQELELTSERTNMSTATTDPIGTIRIRRLGHANPGLPIPTDSWQAIPGTTAPVLEARGDGHYPIGYIRVRQQ